MNDANAIQLFAAALILAGAPMSSADVRDGLRVAGMKGRVRDLKIKFRICDLPKSEYGPQLQQFAVDMGFTDPCGVPGGMWNGTNEFIAYKPGVIRLV